MTEPSCKKLHQEHRVSQTCKYFKNCPLDWDCLVEISLHGFAVWSLELCYDLINLINNGLVKRKRMSLDVKLFLGMRSTFFQKEVTVRGNC